MDGEPITDVCIVSDPISCPGGYILIDKTHDKREDADLWKDGYWKKRTLRYLCVQTSQTLQNRDVLVDVTIINEKDPQPHGYMCLEFTSDTKERAMKKRQICVRYMASSLTQDAISDIIFLSPKKRPPPGYTLVGDLNSIQLCFKLSPIKVTVQQNLTSPNLPYSKPATSEQSEPSSPGHTHSMPKYGTHHRMGSAAQVYNPMAGVPWQINPRLQNTGPSSDGPLPQLDIKSYEAIESKYAYSFQLEKTASTHNISPHVR